jgi:predicted AAA+ superfamily ATPase
MSSKKPRYLFEAVNEVLPKKMALIAGPRQVGKSTFVRSLFRKSLYLNWDDFNDQKQIKSGEISNSEKVIIFDEIHKYSRWRQLIKGLYDKKKDQSSILVTGSAKLDYYSKGGDSLLGRYRLFRMHPFSLGELNFSKDAETSLMKFGGFPEPFLTQNEQSHRIWQRQRAQLLLREDVRDLELVRDISRLDLLMDALPLRVGSPLSLENLRQDLECSHDAVRNWLDIFERLYISFRISPFGPPKIKAVKKEQKLYLWDWSQIEEDGPRFENMVASHLLKYCQFIEDTEGHNMELRYLRDTLKREVDFVVLKDKKVLFAVEVKNSDKAASEIHSYFRSRTQISKFYQVHLGNKDYGNEDKDTRVLPFRTFCKELGLP